MIALGSIARYPVKGFPAEPLSSTRLVAGEGLRDDRRYAITNGISDTKNGDWLTCRSFFINSVNDGLLKFANECDEETVTLASPNGMRLSWRKGDQQSLALANRKMAEFIAPLRPVRDLPAPVITERTQLPGITSGYWDFNDSAVSIMNPASLATLAQAMDKDLDPRRLRGNLYLEDLPAWEEFAWLGKRIRIGSKGTGAELDILRPVMRCPATAVNPETGERDLKVADALSEHFGHGFCGLYARVVKSGDIKTGDAIEVISDAGTSLEEAANPQDTNPRQWPRMAEVISAEALPMDESGKEARRLSITSTGPWQIPEAKAGQRIRFHIACGLVGVAMVDGRQDQAMLVRVEASDTDDPAAAWLMETAKPGDRLIVSGPYGRV